MAYENDRWMFVSAVVVTAVAAGVLRSKKAGFIALGLCTLMCHPESMDRASWGWLNDFVEELETLRAGLKKLVADSEEKKYWGGANEGAFAIYREASDSFDKKLAKCVEVRKSTGETLQQKAKHGHGLTLFADSVGATMGSLMIGSLAVRLLPVANQLAVGLAIEGITHRINSRVMSVLQKTGVTVTTVAGIFGAVGVSYESLASEMRKMEAGPDFAKTELKYVKDKGLSLKDLDPSKSSDPSTLQV